MTSPASRVRAARTGIVVRTEQLAPDMVRVVLTGDDLLSIPELTYTDHYVKLLFAPAGAPYRWPFDVEQIKQVHAKEHWPVTRTYTIRSFDRATNELAVDFVIHGDEGLAGPWAAAAGPGDTIGFFGPGGGYAPDPAITAHLLVGDESAIPAIAASLERIPDGARVTVLLEVASAAHHQPLPVRAGTTVTWVHRSDRGTPYGAALADAVLAGPLPTGTVQAFVHGNADMVRIVRRHLFVERGWDRSRVSISGYWRTGHTEDRWQATKREFNAAMESDAPQPAGAPG